MFNTLVNRNTRGAQPMRFGFTLVELLVTIAIIAILASLFLGGMVSSQEQAKIARTQSTIAKINNLIMQRYESYRTRRVPFTIVTTATGIITNGPNGPTAVATNSPTAFAAGWRVDAIRELMRCELPDRWMDVLSAPLTAGAVTGTSRPALPTPSLLQAYQRKYNSLNALNASNPTIQYQGAECLYMICTTGVSDEMDNRDLFKQGEIGDVDSDGAPEFIDAWGNPISFLRWAPGFVSELQPHSDPDPFDPRFIYPSVSGSLGATGQNNGPLYPPATTQSTQTFALYPLIFSAGPDKLYGIVSLPPSPGYFGYVPNTNYSTNNNNNPFASMLDSTFTFGPIGTRADIDNSTPANTTANSADNIHNHLMGTR